MGRKAPFEVNERYGLVSPITTTNARIAGDRTVCVDALGSVRFNVLMSLLQIPDSIYIGVTDAIAASLWYTEKLGLLQVVAPTSDAGDCISLAFSKRDETAITIGPRDSSSDQRPVLYSTNIGKANDQLSSRGVSVTPIASDPQGTRYFVMRDLEGNEIEVSEEP